MPAKGIRGGKLAQEILRLSEQLEGDFRREFFDEIATYANNAAIKRLLNDIDSGKFTATSSISTALEKVVFASERLDAIARKALGKSARISAKTTVGFELKFNVINPEVVAVARTMSINLSTALNKSTKEILRKIIQDAVEGNLTTIQAAIKIRNHVGLIPAHSAAVDRYYDTLIQSGMKTKLAQKQADAYAQRLLKYRGETIARTEVARAVGEGQTAMWKQMVQDGYLPVDAKRVWITALDERTCQICEPMNGVETDIYGSWSTPNGFVSYPQFTHPNCRCTQGIVMPKASRSKVGKASELELSQWLLSKFNPHHDELGRFTSGPGGAKEMSYRISHQPDTDSDSVRFHELDRAMPNFYSQPKLYITSDTDDYYGSREAISSAKKARGNPNAEIKIYRAVPKGVKTINPKDWVTTSKKYAEHHAQSNSEYGKPMVVIEATAKAKDISFGGNDGFEFGYVGSEAISKANPHHDEIGRFTFSPTGKKVGAATKSKKVYIGISGKVYTTGGRKEPTKTIADQSEVQESGEYKPSQELIQAFESYTFGGGDYYVVQHQANLKPQTSSKKLHRGMTFDKEDFDEFVGEVKVGKQFQIQSSSWTESLSVAKEFASEDAPSGSMGDYSVVMSVSAGAKGVHIEPYAYVDWKYQKEWYLGDAKYKVTGISVKGKRATVSLDYIK